MCKTKRKLKTENMPWSLPSTHCLCWVWPHMGSHIVFVLCKREIGQMQTTRMSYAKEIGQMQIARNMLFYQIRYLSLLVEKLLGCQLVCLDQDRLHNWKALLLQSFIIAISIFISPAKMQIAISISIYMSEVGFIAQTIHTFNMGTLNNTFRNY